MPTPPTSPYPNLQFWPTSGLTFQWTEWTGGATMSVADAQLGPDGVAWVLQMLIFWDDLPGALQEILGYSWRDGSGAVPVLRRKLPWQCPWANQLWVKNVASVKGVQLRGHELVVGAFAGSGFTPNTGPWTQWQYALLTIHFWRPPYFVRTDSDIRIPSPFDPAPAMVPAEWLRYVDKHWQPETQFLSRENQQFEFAPGQGSVSGNLFPGAVGQKLGHQKVTRRWYEIPEQGLFEANLDSTPTGLPSGLMFMRSTTTNPITGYIQDSTVAGFSKTYPLPGCVNSPLDGGVSDANAANRIWGCYMGTLLLEGYEIIPRPLQLPAYLMGIPFFSGSEPIAQQQYDVVFHFDLFDPPRSNFNVINNAYIRGHNMMPYPLDGMWYAAESQGAVLGTAPPKKTTSFQYANFYDMFQII